LFRSSGETGGERGSLSSDRDVFDLEAIEGPGVAREKLSIKGASGGDIRLLISNCFL
jgi:hypothetical protein